MVCFTEGANEMNNEFKIDDHTELLRFSPKGEITFFWDAIEKHSEKPLCLQDVTIGFCKALMKLKREQTK